MATIVSPQHSNPIKDAEIIKKASKGLGTNEKAIIGVLGHRDASQIKQIKLAYKEVYQQDLVDQLKCELSGNILRALTLWVMDPIERDAVLANEAITKSTPGGYDTLLEIVCTKSPDELLAVKRAYHSIYKRALEEDVASHSSGNIGKFLVAMVSTYKYHGTEVDEVKAAYDGRMIHEEIKDAKSNYEEIIKIISTRSNRQLLATLNHFMDIHKTSFTKALKADPKNEFFARVRTSIRCIKNHKRYFAKILFNATKGLGTDEDVLDRVIITRAEIDLKEIKEIYFLKHSVALDQAVEGDTSGDYKTFLLTLLGTEGYRQFI